MHAHNARMHTHTHLCHSLKPAGHRVEQARICLCAAYRNEAESGEMGPGLSSATNLILALAKGHFFLSLS